VAPIVIKMGQDVMGWIIILPVQGDWQVNKLLKKSLFFKLLVGFVEKWFTVQVAH
jgi:hypothetical protein